MAKRAQKAAVTLESLFELVTTGFSALNARLGGVETRLGGVETRVENIDERLHAVEDTVTKTQVMVFDLQEEVASINFALENDATRYFDHERRITRLEKARA